MTVRRALSDSERVAWLRLARTESIGPTGFAGLMARFGDPREALKEAPRLARRGGASGELRIPTEADARAEIEALSEIGGRLIASCEPEFPTGLAALDPPPPVISVLGRLDTLRREMIAIVGARNASGLGIKFATQLARELGEAGLVVASGLARGIDHAAHTGALDTGTVAVVAGGIDVVYPPENAPLYAKIAKQGAVIAELPLRTARSLGISPAGTGSSPGSRAAWLWSRPRNAQARSSRQTTRSSRGARCSRCPGLRSIRERGAATGLSGRAQRSQRQPRTCSRSSARCSVTTSESRRVPARYRPPPSSMRRAPKPPELASRKAGPRPHRDRRTDPAMRATGGRSSDGSLGAGARRTCAAPPRQSDCLALICDRYVLNCNPRLLHGAMVPSLY